MVRSRRTKVAPENKLRICCAPTAVGCCCPRFAQHPDQHPLRRHRCNRTALGRSRSAGSLVRLGNPRSTAFATQRIPDGDLLRRRRRRRIRAERRTVVRGCIEDAHDYANRFWDSQRNGDFFQSDNFRVPAFRWKPRNRKKLAQSWDELDCLASRRCDRIGDVAHVDFSLLDVPRSVPVDDPEAYLRAAIAWHFGEDTGSAFWLRTAKTLDFNPLTDINTFTDLRLFPNLVNELRGVPVEDLIPRGYKVQGSEGSRAPLPQIFESGGTTGAPKRTAQLPDWIAQVIEWQTEDFATGGFLRRPGFLVPDAQRPAWRWLLLPPGLRAARRGIPPNRHRPPLGQKARRPQRRLGSGRLHRPRHRAGRVHSADAECREFAYHSAVA